MSSKLSDHLLTGFLWWVLLGDIVSPLSLQLSTTWNAVCLSVCLPVRLVTGLPRPCASRPSLGYRRHTLLGPPLSSVPSHVHHTNVVMSMAATRLSTGLLVVPQRGPRTALVSGSIYSRLLTRSRRLKQRFLNDDKNRVVIPVKSGFVTDTACH